METKRILLTEVHIQQNIVNGAYIFQDRCDRGQQPTTSTSKKVSKLRSGMRNPNRLVKEIEMGHRERERKKGRGIGKSRKARHK